MEELQKLFKAMDINPKDNKRYVEALTHMSFSHESKNKAEPYERLEFLGDSILGFFVAKHIFNNYKEMEPGQMTLLKSNMVNKSSLSKIGRSLDLQNYMFLGKGENKDKLSDSVYEDIIESLIGAIYLDLGYNQTQKFIKNFVFPKIDQFDLDDLKDYKTKLQEFLQSETRKSVTYDTVSIKDKNKNLIFKAKVIFEDQVLGEGTGNSKNKAEQEAASDAYGRLVT